MIIAIHCHELYTRYFYIIKHFTCRSNNNKFVSHLTWIIKQLLYPHFIWNDNKIFANIYIFSHSKTNCSVFFYKSCFICWIYLSVLYLSIIMLPTCISTFSSVILVKVSFSISNVKPLRYSLVLFIRFETLSFSIVSWRFDDFISYGPCP